MSAGELKKWILEQYPDIEFRYQGKHGSICAFNCSDFSLCFHEITKEFNDIDSLMTDPFFDGKSLNEIAGELQFD